MTTNEIPDVTDGGKLHADHWSTEQEAALLQTSERKRAMYRQVIEFLGKGRENLVLLGDEHPGLTDDELRYRLQGRNGIVSKSGPATRRGELVDLGLVRPQRATYGPPVDGPMQAGIVKRPSDLGGPMIVWEVVPADEYVAPTPTSAERQPNAAGLAVAREVADWQMGEPSLANEIVRAYLNPKVVAAELARERGEF